MQEKRKLFVGGLAPHTTRESLAEHFSKYGEVQDCVLMMDRVTGRSRCFGFVTMREAESLDQILSQEQTVDGKKVDCKPAVPRDPTPSAQSEPPQSFRTKKMFVGGLPPDITEEAFSGFFSQFGSLEDTVVMYDRDTGRPRGFGFITFASEDSVERVLENYESNYISGKWVECKKALPKHMQYGETPNPFGYMPYMMYQPPVSYAEFMQPYDMYGYQEQSFVPANSEPAPPAFNDETRDQIIQQRLIEDLLGEDKEEPTNLG